MADPMITPCERSAILQLAARSGLSLTRDEDPIMRFIAAFMETQAPTIRRAHLGDRIIRDLTARIVALEAERCKWEERPI